MCDLDGHRNSAPAYRVQALAVAVGALASQLLHTVPARGCLWFMAALSVPLLLVRKWRVPGLALAALTWCLFSFQHRLDDRLAPNLNGQWLTLTGTVISIPRVTADSIHFLFRPDNSAGSSRLPGQLLLSAYREWPDIRAGQRWRLQARLKPPRGRVNFSGPDRERWLFAQGIGAVGIIRDAEYLAPGQGVQPRIQALRERIGVSIAAAVPGADQRAVLNALAIADRNGMSADLRALLSLTGTAHLLAISGLHIGLAAVGGMFAARALLGALLWGRAGRVSLALAWLAGLGSALSYAVLADLGVSTLRSALMLLAGAVALLGSRCIHPLQALLLALATVLLLDPFAPLMAGFWFSFLAVLALLLVFRPRVGRLSRTRSLVMAQGSVITVLLPVSAAWFGAFSLAGFAANLVAIPWVSLFLVPFVLGAVVLLPLAPELAEIAWATGARSVTVLLAVLEYFAWLQGKLVTLARPSLWQGALALAGALLLLGPAGIGWRFYGLFLLLPLFLPIAVDQSPGHIEAEILDVGQGTSVLVHIGRQTLLYDSGPGDGAAYSLVGPVISPALEAQGHGPPDRVVISHGDMDHAGGLPELLRRFPGAHFLANLPPEQPAVSACTAGHSWRWGAVNFKVLHPSSGLPYLGNDSSCVISVRSPANGFLLSGDISARVEARLLADGLVEHPAVLVPHHGSLSSSGRAFIERLRPGVAVNSAGPGNRFGFPRDEVRNRYLQAGAAFWDTGDCGAVRLVLDAQGGIAARSARRHRNRIWRWPAADNCP